MSFSIYLSQSFKRSVKRLERRFPHVIEDVTTALDEVIHWYVHC